MQTWVDKLYVETFFNAKSELKELQCISWKRLFSSGFQKVVTKSAKQLKNTNPK